ncbi:helix-turn-helix transcriptional regulator [Amycolatopsis anabasis]|uniref:helix-turn-helix transcriptional regulator n=1 Tax=Amycolatopsis anabasis TaxID=1840409 RepID=UPI001FE86113|nr:LuxR family transcriptional regulator [Amycolatopsis anabasis]
MPGGTRPAGETGAEDIFLGRDDFLAVARERLAAGSVLLHGPVGIGRSSVLAALLGNPGDALVLRSSPDSEERRIPFLVLADLLEGLPARLFDELPEPQRHAVEHAVRRRGSGDRLDSLALRWGVLSLLRSASARRPVLLVLDDAQWADDASVTVLSFAAARLRPPAVRMLVAERVDEPDEPARGSLCTRPAGLLAVPPLTSAATAELVAYHGQLAPDAPATLNACRLAAGNPLFAVELARGLADCGPAGDPLEIPPRLSRIVSEQLRGLSRETRELLLVAALSRRPDLDLLVHFGRWDAATALAQPAARRIVRLGVSGEVRFRHPLLAAGLRAQASPERVREVHSRLAASVSDPLERARHRACAVEGHDERTAAMLIRAAAVARRQGALARAAELGALAAERTPPDAPARLAGRRLRAAGDALDAGRHEFATALAHTVLRSSSAPRQHRVRAQLVIVDAVRNARNAVDGVVGKALAQARGDSALEGAARYRFGVHSALGGDFRQAVAQLADAVVLARDARDVRTEVPALCSLALCQIALGDRTADRTLNIARVIAPEDLVVTHDGPAWVTARLDLFADRLRPAAELLGRLLDRAAERGTLSEVIGMNWAAVEVWVAQGECGNALRRANECLRLAEATDSDLALACYGAALAEAYGGNPALADAVARRGVARAERDGDCSFLLRNLHAQGLAALGLGDATTALEPLRRAVRLERQMGVADPAVFGVQPDIAEPLVACGHLAEAAEVLGGARAGAVRLRRRGVLAALDRAEGLLHLTLRNYDRAEEALRAAVEAHDRLCQPLQYGRSLLALGIAERRRKRRGAARAALLRAQGVFVECGAPVWARRASTLLGDAPAPGVAPVTMLTGWEWRIARLVTEGASNPEVAGKLDISVKTVEGALTRIYRKLDVRSRTQLSARLRESPARPPSPRPGAGIPRFER